MYCTMAAIANTDTRAHLTDEVNTTHHIDGTGRFQLSLRRQLGIQFSSHRSRRTCGGLRGRGLLVSRGVEVFGMYVPFGASFLPWRLSLHLATGEEDRLDWENTNS